MSANDPRGDDLDLEALDRALPWRQRSRVSVPVGQRVRPSRLRALAAFEPAMAWLYACVLGSDRPAYDEEHTFVDLRAVHPMVRQRLEEEIVRAVRAIDPVAEAAARHQARKVATERVDALLQAEGRGRVKERWIRDRAIDLADAVLAVYRGHLIDGEARR